MESPAGGARQPILIKSWHLLTNHNDLTFGTVNEKLALNLKMNLEGYWEVRLNHQGGQVAHNLPVLHEFLMQKFTGCLVTIQLYQNTIYFSEIEVLLALFVLQMYKKDVQPIDIWVGSLS